MAKKRLTITGTSTHVTQGPLAERPAATLTRGLNLDFDNGFGIKIQKYVATFVPREGIFGERGDPFLLIRESMTAGIIVNCLKDVWYVETEPTSEKTFGLVVYAPQELSGWRARKPIMRGEGEIASSQSGTTTSFSIETLYAYIRSSPRRDHVSASGSIGRGKVRMQVSYSIEF
jgi:hypothetical protein